MLELRWLLWGDNQGLHYFAQLEAYDDVEHNETGRKGKAHTG